MNHHTSYPFGLHTEFQLLWHYCSVDNIFYLQSNNCKGISVNEGSSCKDCLTLTKNDTFLSVQDCIHYGIHPSTPLIYYPIGGLIALTCQKIDQLQSLKLFCLNDSQKLVGKVAALEDHKQWVMAVASRCVNQVAALAQAVLNHGGSICALVSQYKYAAENVYQPKGYTQDEILKLLALLCLGGTRVVEFAHHALLLPSITVACHNSTMCPLVVSIAQPNVQEVEANI